MMKIATASILLLLAAQTATANALTAADAARCKAMAGTLAPKKAEIQEMQTERDAMAVTVEVKGEAWEDAEAVRLFSAAHAEAADVAKAEYDALRKQLANKEMALQAQVGQFNQDISAYNQSCATKK